MKKIINHYKASGGNFSTSYSYDKHGNMMSYVQRGVKTKGAQNNSYDMVDNLAMSYNGNQLINVHNGGTGSNESTSAHFDDYSKDPNKTKVEYTYNANGAMTADLNKGSTIQYNSLSLPTILTIDNTKARGDIQYTYSASGQKLRTVHKEDMNLARMPVVGVGAYATPSWIITTTDYVGNKIYEQVGNNARVLKRILIDGGYYDAVKKKYFYYLTDHLGNNRVVVEANGTVAQKTHYYPFGMAFAEETVKGEGQKEQPYKYNGKELDRRLQLNTYDYSARYMDPAIGRFTSVDPHAENYYSWSPYVYVGNNPLRLTDPTGMDWWTDNQTGNIHYVRGLSNLKNLDIKYANYLGIDLNNFGKYEKLGGDNMFGSEVSYDSNGEIDNLGAFENILNSVGLTLEGSDASLFMLQQGYSQVEVVGVEEQMLTARTLADSKNGGVGVDETYVEYPIKETSLGVSYAKSNGLRLDKPYNIKILQPEYHYGQKWQVATYDMYKDRRSSDYSSTNRVLMSPINRALNYIKKHF